MRYKLVLGPLTGYFELSGDRPRREIFIAVLDGPSCYVWKPWREVEKFTISKMKFVWYGDWESFGVPILYYQHESNPQPARKPDWTTIDAEGYAVGQYLPEKKEKVNK